MLTASKKKRKAPVWFGEMQILQEHGEESSPLLYPETQRFWK